MNSQLRSSAARAIGSYAVMAPPLMARTPGIFSRSNTSSIRQKPTRLPYSCHDQLGMSGIGDPPAGGVRTVRGIGSSGFHSSTLTITQTTRRATPGSFSGGRWVMAEYGIRSLGNMWEDLELEKGSIYAGGEDDFDRMLTHFDRHRCDTVRRSCSHAARAEVHQRRASADARLLARRDNRRG